MDDFSPLELSSLLTVTDDRTLLAYNELTERACSSLPVVLGVYFEFFK